ncbi:MAG: DUF3822 family protein [Bacteroidia bacterium]
MKTVSLNIKTKITAPGFDFANHARYHACIDISPSEIVFALFSLEHELVFLQHCVLKANEKALDTLQHLVDAEPFFSQSYLGVFVSVSNSVYTLVPGALFVKENREEVLRFNHNVANDSIVLSDEIMGADSHCIYAIDKRVKELLDKIFPNNHLKHKVSCLIESLPNLASKNRKTCLVNVQGNTMDVSLYNKKLQFFNSFEFQTAEDFLYYILATLEQNTFALDETDVILAGEVEAGSAIYATLSEYIPKLKFAVAGNTIVKKNDFAALPEHFYYTLLNLYLCAL